MSHVPDLRPVIDPRLVARRWFLKQCAVGLGAIGLADLLGGSASGVPKATDPLATRQPHFTPKAKSVIYLFMAGGPSHLELFDNKPELARSKPPAQYQEHSPPPGVSPRGRLVGVSVLTLSHCDGRG